MTETTSIIGQRVPRINAPEKLTGNTKYVGDLKLPRMLFCKIKRSTLPHAKLLNIDTGKAEKLAGVKAIVTAKDTPNIRMGWFVKDETVFAYEKVRYIGEGVAAVAATGEDTAIEALGLIEVEYEQLPAVFDPEEAMKDEAPKVHELIMPGATCAWEDWGLARKARSLEIQNNIATTFKASCGDTEQGFRESDYIREDKFFIPANAHVCLEPHDIVASYDPFSQKLDVWLGHMGYEVKRYWLAKTLGLPITKVRTHNVYVGGAFGGNALRALTDRQTNFASDRVFNNLLNIAGFGPGATNTAANSAQNTGNNIASLLSGIGAAQAGGFAGAAGSINNAVQGGLNNFLFNRDRNQNNPAGPINDPNTFRSGFFN